MPKQDEDFNLDEALERMHSYADKTRESFGEGLDECEALVELVNTSRQDVNEGRVKDISEFLEDLTNRKTTSDWIDEVVIRQSVCAHLNNPTDEEYITMPEWITSAEDFSVWVKSV